ncbi:MAG: hypothetical protein ACLFP2_02335 [Candidatus Woesearchaeota archaeon]
MSVKDQCKEIMHRLFGEASAALVDEMDEETCVEKCKKKTADYLGQAIADYEFSKVK